MLGSMISLTPAPRKTMTSTRLTKDSTSSKSSAFARHGEARARKGYAKTDLSRRINEEPESVFAP